MVLDMTYRGESLTTIYEKMYARNVAGTQARLHQQHVVILGAGGLGSNIALALARAGVGKLTVIDFDDVDYSNLNRQQFRMSQVGISKVVALQQNISEVAPFTTVISHHERVTSNNILQLCAGADVVCEAFDNPDTKAMALQTLADQSPETPLVMGNGMAGLHDPNLIQTRRYRKNVYICGDGVSTGAEGLMAPRVLICAGHQATTILNILLEAEENNNYD